jgi:hypothetical protein
MPTEPFLKMVARHDADLAFVRRHDAGAVGADQPRVRLVEDAPSRLIMSEHRDALGDADDELGISASMASMIAAAAPAGGT